MNIALGNNASERIFWAEADDDALRLEDKDAARSALLAYLLLRRQVVLHPAYIWQSTQTHSTVLSEGTALLLGPPHVHLILGDASNVEEYIVDRKAKLQREARIRHTPDIPELYQYSRHGDGLIRDSARLDERFTDSNAVHQISWSCDDHFRRAVRRELTVRTFTGDCLYGLIYRTPGRCAAYKLDDVVQKMIDRTQSKRMLCSVDSLIAMLIKEGFDPHFLGPVFDRLHILHWESYSGPGLRVPLLSRVMHDSLDPYDPKVFWSAMHHLIGGDMRTTLLELPWVDACKIVADLTSHDEWIEFVRSYESIVSVVDSDCEEIAQAIVKEQLDKRYPSWFQTLRRDGRPGKFAVLSLVCGILGFSSGVTSVGVIGLVATLGDIVKQWVGITKRYFNGGERQTIKTYIHGALRRANKDWEDGGG